MQSKPSIPDANKKRLEFSYDADGRRISKKVFAWNTQSLNWELTSASLFVVGQGFNLLAETDQTQNLKVSYVWGTDLSGSFDGAGGVGGLLFSHKGTENTEFYCYDLNGNVANLIDTTGTVTASYDYDPFGNIIKSAGANAAENRFKFSTKYLNSETGLSYYGYRFYDPGLGRWPNRDPIGEKGGINLFSFLRNRPTNTFDTDGRREYENWTGEETYTPRDAAEEGKISGELSIDLKDYFKNVANGTLMLGFELSRTGDFRLEYDKIVREAKRLGLPDKEANALRDAIKAEYQAKGPKLYQALTQKILAERARSGHVQGRSNAFKTNIKITNQGKVFAIAGRATIAISWTIEVITVATSDDPLNELPRSGGRLGGAAAGAWLGAEVGAPGGPYGIAAGIVVGAISGSIVGEGIVDRVCEEEE